MKPFNCLMSNKLPQTTTYYGNWLSFRDLTWESYKEGGRAGKQGRGRGSAARHASASSLEGGAALARGHSPLHPVPFYSDGLWYKYVSFPQNNPFPTPRHPSSRKSISPRVSASRVGPRAGLCPVSLAVHVLTSQEDATGTNSYGDALIFLYGPRLNYTGDLCILAGKKHNFKPTSSPDSVQLNSRENTSRLRPSGWGASGSGHRGPGHQPAERGCDAADGPSPGAQRPRPPVSVQEAPSIGTLRRAPETCHFTSKTASVSRTRCQKAQDSKIKATRRTVSIRDEFLDLCLGVTENKTCQDPSGFKRLIFLVLTYNLEGRKTYR